MAPTRTPWLRPMLGRSVTEAHRTSTPLEALVDLCFVVAVGAAGARLRIGLSAGHPMDAVISYTLVFFTIWWAWMNFTWFASAYDTDDVPYRLTVMVQIAGVLVLAAGVPRIFVAHDGTIVTLGYAIMRLGLISQWLRAARSHPAGRPAAYRVVAGVSLCLLGWTSLLVLPAEWRLPAWLVLVPAELFVPVWAQRTRPTPWHPQHIAERYGLFVIIVLGEVVFALTIAVQMGLESGDALSGLLPVAGGGLVAAFAMWWLYFDHPPHELLRTARAGHAADGSHGPLAAQFLWGYGHVVLLAAAAAFGAGLTVSVDAAAGRAHLSAAAVGAAVAVPAALFVLSVWVLQVRTFRLGPVANAAFPLASVLVLASAGLGQPVPLIGLILAALVAQRVLGGLAPD